MADTNVRGTENVLDAAHDARLRERSTSRR